MPSLNDRPSDEDRDLSNWMRVAAEIDFWLRWLAVMLLAAFVGLLVNGLWRYLWR